MFKKKSKSKKPAGQVASPATVLKPVLKYERPKILLLDFDSVTKTTLQHEGYNVSVGTFGKRYKVQKSSDYTPVILEASLPNAGEQEIIVVDLAPAEPSDAARGEKLRPMEELDWWAKCSNGVIDPRSRAMVMIHERFDRIYQNGGAFIIFATSRDKQKLVCLDLRKK